MVSGVLKDLSKEKAQMHMMYVAVLSDDKASVLQFASEDGVRFEVMRADRNKIRQPKRVLKGGIIRDGAERKVVASLNCWCSVDGCYEFWSSSAEAAAAAAETIGFAKCLFGPKPNRSGSWPDNPM